MNTHELNEAKHQILAMTRKEKNEFVKMAIYMHEIEKKIIEAEEYDDLFFILDEIGKKIEEIR